MKTVHWKIIAFMAMGAAVFFACKENLSPNVTMSGGNSVSEIFVPNAYAQARNSAGVGHTNWRCGCQSKTYPIKIGTANPGQTQTLSEDVLNEWACLPGTLVTTNASCYCCAATAGAPVQ